jgi:Cof subfamily protein (haloacid dehalogenase superfamily)
MNSSQNAIKVIITDLDGTLLNSDHKISSYTKTIFKALHDQNYIIIVATGRHHLDAFFIIEDLEIPIYLVTSNGARIHAPDKELLYAFDIKSDAIKSVLDLEIDSEITTVLFKEEVWLTNKKNEKLNSFQTKITYKSEIVNFAHLEDLSGIKLLFTDENHEKLIALRDQILVNYSNDFSLAFSLPICLEIMDKTVDKSFAIAKILEKENLTFQETICFGDGFNDEKMLLSAQKSLIMGNAPENLKTKLSHLEIIKPNHEDGVAKYIAERILKEKHFYNGNISRKC